MAKLDLENIAGGGPRFIATPRRDEAPGVIGTAIRWGDRLFDCLGYRAGSPSLESALATVADEPGQAALSDPLLIEPLEQWIAALRDAADLNAIGRIAAQWDIERLLRIACRLRDEEERDPSILDEPIEAPIVITGMPRSGSTFLHALLSEDPGNRVARCWQGLAPYPPRKGRDRRAVEAERQLRMMVRMAPGISSLHLLHAEAPQECSELMAPSFRSLRFDTTHHVPGYRHWLDGAGHYPAYAFLRRLLQHLQRQTGRGRWVLKCPDHVFALDALQASFPDARFVFMHRDPLKVLPSAARLTEIIRRPFSRKVDPIALGRHVTRDWREGAVRIVEAARSIPSDRLAHIHFQGIRDRPMKTVTDLYAHFGLTLSPLGRQRMEQKCEARPRGGYGRNRYQFADHGIDPVGERIWFRNYMETFGVLAEV